MRMQVILDSSFARPGSAPIWDGKKGEFRDWTMLNVDAKIASKVIAERLKRVLPNLTHENQSGYVPGPNICENIRSILDIMEYTKDSNKPGILFFIDFEKAFDSLEWDFLNKCLEIFNFWPEFIRWVNIFYKNIQSYVINNGLCCDYLTIIPRARMGSESIAHEAEGRMGY